jgi:pantothenate kinase
MARREDNVRRTLDTETMVTFDQLTDRARSLVAGSRRAVVGITGAPGAGKTTLAEQLVTALAPAPPAGLPAYGWVVHVPMDGFHLADVELDRLQRRDRKGAPDTFDALGYAALLRRLREDVDEMIYAPGFERTLEQPIAGMIGVPRAARLVVTEGNYLLMDTDGWAGVRAMLDEVWYVDLDPAERLRRLVDRHLRFGKDEQSAVAWATGTDERNAAVIAATKGAADLIVPAEVMHRLGAPPA